VALGIRVAMQCWCVDPNKLRVNQTICVIHFVITKKKLKRFWGWLGNRQAAYLKSALPSPKRSEALFEPAPHVGVNTL
jgi:hypothetical protein